MAWSQLRSSSSALQAIAVLGHRSALLPIGNEQLIVGPQPRDDLIHINLGDDAIRLQIIAAMIAYLLLRLARRLNSLRMLD
ncbi:hypothetical protein, partial [Bradyrhizobium sp. 143]|uniref:hypothetical protein n=1 Tax=Bradyrhizobium sp. 143 TaxID=2782619 RepID=UPI001FF9684F